MDTHKKERTTPRFGAHVSTAGGVSNALVRAQSIHCETMQIFTRNNNRWQAKPLRISEIERWQELVTQVDIYPIISHASYLINLASPDPQLWQKSIETFIDELQRAEALGLLGVVLHPGSHKGMGERAGIERIAAALDQCHRRTAGFRTLTLLETTAGTGNHLGYRFEQLAAIRQKTEMKPRISFCFDTCHVFAAGYDLRTPAAYEATMEAFSRHIGLHRLTCFHLNDSQHELGSRKDRHTHIGEGYIGLEGFRLLVTDPRFQEIPMILETPKGKDMREDVMNLTTLRELVT